MIGTQIAPTYLSSCLNQGLGLLEILLLKQPIQDNRQVLKVCLFYLVFFQCFCSFYLSPKTCFCEQTLELCRLYELENVSTNIMKVNVVCNTRRTFILIFLKHLFMTILGFEHGLASI